MYKSQQTANSFSILISTLPFILNRPGGLTELPVPLVDLSAILVIGTVQLCMLVFVCNKLLFLHVSVIAPLKSAMVSSVELA